MQALPPIKVTENPTVSSNYNSNPLQNNEKPLNQ